MSDILKLFAVTAATDVVAAGGDALRAGLGARELPMGLANPDPVWNPEMDPALPLTEALALTKPLIPIPWSKSDIVGGEGLPADVPDAIEPKEPIPPPPTNCVWLNWELRGDGWECCDVGDCIADPERLCPSECAGCAGTGLSTVMFAPASSTLVNAETAESSTLGTVSSSASVVLDRGIRCGFAFVLWLVPIEDDRNG
ncbi:hypothetical protein FRC15_007987 [Serendipita sp. 397]|nr:hypothetical protein FRC15_007987 [Serendipita sp. 397]